jgi:hypothetical protein
VSISLTIHAINGYKYGHFVPQKFLYFSRMQKRHLYHSAMEPLQHFPKNISSISKIRIAVRSLKHFFHFVALLSIAGYGLLILEACRSHKTIRHSRYDSSGLVISSSQRPQQHATLTTDTHPCLRRDSNTQSRQASGNRPSPLLKINVVK